MNFINKIKIFIKRYLFNVKWCCNNCGKEIFSGKYFCEKCEKELPYNDGYVCEHCGRKLSMPLSYCTTCKDNLVDIDKCRSVFVYKEPISYMIQGAKYSGKRYLLEMFASYLEPIYQKNCFDADYICYVPMTDKALKRRGYNQSKILAEELSKRINVQVLDCLKKIKETDRQAKLNRKERLKNLKGAFKIVNGKRVENKSIVLVDDVSTTGATAQVIASTLKSAGAKSVYLLSVASVAPREGY